MIEERNIDILNGMIHIPRQIIDIDDLMAASIFPVSKNTYHTIG